MTTNQLYARNLAQHSYSNNIPFSGLCFTLFWQKSYFIIILNKIHMNRNYLETPQVDCQCDILKHITTPTYMYTQSTFQSSNQQKSLHLNQSQPKSSLPSSTKMSISKIKKKITSTKLIQTHQKQINFLQMVAHNKTKYSLINQNKPKTTKNIKDPKNKQATNQIYNTSLKSKSNLVASQKKSLFKSQPSLLMVYKPDQKTQNTTNIQGNLSYKNTFNLPLIVYSSQSSPNQQLTLKTKIPKTLQTIALIDQSSEKKIRQNKFLPTRGQNIFSIKKEEMNINGLYCRFRINQIGQRWFVKNNIQPISDFQESIVSRKSKSYKFRTVQSQNDNISVVGDNQSMMIERFPIRFNSRPSNCPSERYSMVPISSYSKAYSLHNPLQNESNTFKTSKNNLMTNLI